MLISSVISREKRVQQVELEMPESVESHNHGFQLPSLRGGGG